MNALAITHPATKENENAVYKFTKTVVSDGENETVKIFANARYKLYLNGALTAVGPLKGTTEERYYDEVCLPLKKGENEITALVLSLKTDGDWADRERLLSVSRSGKACLAVESALLSTESGWKCALSNDIEFFSEPVTASIGMNERVTIKEYEPVDPVPYKRVFTEEAGSNEYGLIAPGILLKKRTIPMMYFSGGSFLSSDGNVYDAGEEKCAFIRVKIKGTGKLWLTYAECRAEKRGDMLVKGVRSDPSLGIYGDYDEIMTDGGGVFESYWFRTFRYVKAECDGVEIEKIDFIETGYPLEGSSDLKLYNETDEKLIKISERTLRRCMHETFTDCPYYEQLQYLMDTYLQTVFSSRISSDYRLIKKAIRDFALSQRADGMLLSRYPSNILQIIPGFALIYSFMVRDYVLISGDLETARKYIPVIEKMLCRFGEQKGEDGLIKKFPNWNFIDWADGFERGIPNSEPGEPLSVLSLMYSSSLTAAADICRMIGRNGEAEEFLLSAREMNENVNSLCYDEEKGLYASSPSKRYFAQHEQVWAVLSGAADGKEKAVMENSLDLEPKATFAFAYFYFRALEKAGLYEKREELLNKMRNLVALDCSTVPETPTDSRSECHAWGSAALFEFSAMDLGIRKIDAVKKEVLIKPCISGRAGAKGSVDTVFGRIGVEWEKKDGFYIKITSPEEFKKTVILPTGERIETFDKVIMRQ